MRILALPVLLGSAVLFAKPGPVAMPRWVKVPAKDGAPEFQYRMEPQPMGFRLQILVPDGFPADRWAAHLWVADEGMVQRRIRAIRSVRESIQEFQALQKDADHAGTECQGALARILHRAEDSLRRLMDYDPFWQACLSFTGSPRQETEGLVQGAFDLDPKGAEGTICSYTFELGGNLDTAGTRIRAMDWGLALVPAGALARRPMRHPWKQPLPLGWSIESQLDEDAALLLKPTKDLKDRVFLASKGRYQVAGNAGTWEPGCFGAEGDFQCVEPWRPLTLREMPLPACRERAVSWRFASFGKHLIVRVPGQPGRTYDLTARIDAGGAEEWRLLDCHQDPQGACALFRVSGPSRPGSSSSYCGAGEETNLLWMMWAPDGRVRSTTSVHIESCFRNLESECSGIEFFDRPWTWEIRESGAAASRMFTYDPTHPGRGLVVGKSRSGKGKGRRSSAE